MMMMMFITTFCFTCRAFRVRKKMSGMNQPIHTIGDILCEQARSLTDLSFNMALINHTLVDHCLISHLKCNLVKRIDNLICYVLHTPVLFLLNRVSNTLVLQLFCTHIATKELKRNHSITAMNHGIVAVYLCVIKAEQSICFCSWIHWISFFTCTTFVCYTFFFTNFGHLLFCDSLDDEVDILTPVTFPMVWLRLSVMRAIKLVSYSPPIVNFVLTSGLGCHKLWFFFFHIWCQS